MEKGDRKFDYKPPDKSLVDNLDELFTTASTMLEGRRLVFVGGDKADKAARDSFFGTSEYSEWKNAFKRANNPGFQLRMTGDLLYLLDGQIPRRRHEKWGPYAEKMVAFWRANLNPRRRETIEQLKSYRSYLLLRKSDWYLLKVGKDLSPGATRDSSAIGIREPKALQRYAGTQAQPFDEPSRMLFGALTASEGYLGGSGSILDFQLPALSSSPVAEQEKFALYGGRRPTLDLSPLGYSVLGLPLPRSVVRQLFEEITKSDHPFLSHTIVAPPGQGKTLALSELIVRLCRTPGYLTLWSLDAAAPFSCPNPEAFIASLLQACESVGQPPRRLTFVFDDLSRRTQQERRQLHHLHDVGQLLADQEGVNLGFVFSVTDHDHSISPRSNTRPLTLEPEEEESLYRILLEQEPVIAQKRYVSLSELLLVTAPAKRRYTNDIQSFVDFVLSNSIRTDVLASSWFSDLSDETALAKDALSIVAVSELLDLPLQPRIAADMINARQERQFRTAEDFLTFSTRLYITEQDPGGRTWRGFALGAPHRARSLLSLLDSLTREFVTRVFSEIIHWSLEYGEANPEGWAETDSEYIRHIFQRLAKQPTLYPIPELKNTRRIADHLYLEYEDRLTTLLFAVRRSSTCGRWAGTISSLGVFRDGENIADVRNAVYECCLVSLARYRKCATIRPDVFVPLLRAVNRLCKVDSDYQEVKQLAFDLADTADVKQVIGAAHLSGRVDWVRRVNEILHGYADLMPRVLNSERARRRIAEIYRYAEQELDGFGFDAGNAARRAESVARQEPRDVRLLAKYLADADAAVRTDARSQATWKWRVDGLIEEFEREHGPLEWHLRDDGSKIGKPEISRKNKRFNQKKYVR